MARYGYAIMLRDVKGDADGALEQLKLAAAAAGQRGAVVLAELRPAGRRGDRRGVGVQLFSHGGFPVVGGDQGAARVVLHPDGDQVGSLQQAAPLCA